MLEHGDNQQTLITLPAEVAHQHIYPLLKQNDVVRLRRVCKATKLTADDYIRKHYSAFEWEINETSHTFASYIQPSLPTSRLYLNNPSGPEFFKDPHIPGFFRLHGSRITHVRVKYFSTCISDPENNFFLGLPNLQHLELEYTDASSRKLGHNFTCEDGVIVPRELCYFPAPFKHLKTLVPGKIKGSDEFDQNYAMDLIEFCCNLEHVSHPIYTNMTPGTTMYKEGPFGCVTENVKKWLAANPDEQIQLKYYDIKNLRFEGLYQPGLLCLLDLCNEHNIKLLNVNASIFEAVGTLLPADFATILLSVKNVDSCMFVGDLPNIEELAITSTYYCSCNYTPSNPGRPKWRNLKVVDINIDSHYIWHEDIDTSALLQFLFANGKRRNLKELRINFDGGRGANNSGVSCPLDRAVAKNCRYLTKLTLSNWFGADPDVSKLWEKLSLLEEVELEECETLGYRAFVGTDRADPAFLKLSNLKKLSLKGLESMPAITDYVFHLVFRHLKIREFCLASNSPLPSVTINGIRSLLTGQFNNFVEKFPFHDWSLQNVSEEAFNRLKSEFRATFMR